MPKRKFVPDTTRQLVVSGDPDNEVLRCRATMTRHEDDKKLRTGIIFGLLILFKLDRDSTKKESQYIFLARLANAQVGIKAVHMSSLLCYLP